MAVYRLTSAPMVFTPSVFRLCLENWAFPVHRGWVREVLGAYGLSPDCIVGLMSGAVPVRFEGGDVVFEFGE
jgi:hypothetical protein